MTTAESNKLIAEFMGLYPRDKKNGEPPMYELTGKFTDDGFPHNVRPYCLQFHSSWDWLMPVVEKIETSLYDLVDKQGATGRRIGATKGTGDFHIFYDEREEYKGWTWSVGLTYGKTIASNTDRETTKIKATYKAVVEFIKWHNKQTK